MEPGSQATWSSSQVPQHLPAPEEGLCACVHAWLCRQSAGNKAVCHPAQLREAFDSFLMPVFPSPMLTGDFSRRSEMNVSIEQSGSLADEYCQVLSTAYSPSGVHHGHRGRFKPLISQSRQWTLETGSVRVKGQCLLPQLILFPKI